MKALRYSNIAMDFGPGLSRCMDPIENGDIPASYVSLPEGNLDLLNQWKSFVAWKSTLGFSWGTSTETQRCRGPSPWVGTRFRNKGMEGSLGDETWIFLREKNVSFSFFNATPPKKKKRKSTTQWHF